MSARLFVSYRRKDSPHAVARFTDYLQAEFGDDRIFLDVHSIETGSYFRERIREVITDSDALVLMIGPRFDVTQLSLDSDYIFFELSEALHQSKPIIPVLIDDAAALRPSELPSALAGVADLHAARLRFDPDFRGDTRRIIDSIQRILDDGPTRPSRTTLEIASVLMPKKEGLSSALTGPVNALAFSSDGARLAGASSTGQIGIWDTRTKLPQGTLTGHEASVVSIMCAPHGSTLASGADDRTVRIWDMRTGRTIRRLSIPSQTIPAIAYSPDGSTLATGSWDKIVRLWNLASGRCENTFSGATHGIKSLAFSPNDSMLASASWDGIIRLWDTNTNRLHHSMEAEARSIGSVRYSPDGSVLASANSNGTIELWDGFTGRPLDTFESHRSAVSALAFSPDGSILASGDDESIVLSDPTSGEVLRRMEQSGTVRDLTFSPNGRVLASAGASKRPHEEAMIWLWHFTPESG